MKMNYKNFRDWNKNDLEVFLYNEDCRECQFLDYKRTLEFLEPCDKTRKQKSKQEFRNDVCSFANADGGYLIVGMAEQDGLASKIMPIKVDNIDRLELELRNALLTIQPSMPNVEFKFISVDQGVVIIIHIEKGFFKPYTTIEEQSIFKFFIRHGNRKDAMSYSEIKDSFLRSGSLSTEIKRFRAERISELLEDNFKSFGVIHVIPSTFMDTTSYISMYDLHKTDGYKISEDLNRYIRGIIAPNVDGIWFPTENEFNDLSLLRIFNNGTVELKYDLDIREYRISEKYLIHLDFLDAISDIIQGTAKMYEKLERQPTMYVCITIIGCKGYRNYSGSSFYVAETKIDRDKIICTPIEIKNILDTDNIAKIIEICKKATKHALGVRT